MDKKLNIKVPDGTTLERIDSYLAANFPELSRSQIKYLISDGMIQSNGTPVKPSTKVHPGDFLSVILPEPVESTIKAENIPLDIIYQDEDIAVVNKPVDMMVHPAGNMYSGTLVNALLYHIDNLSGINGVLKPGIVHRLDMDTSGVIVIAKNDQSHRHLQEQFEYRTMQKTYLAVIWGCPDKKEGEIDKAIKRSKRNRQKMISGEHGKESLTLYKVIEVFRFLSLLEVYPRSGRTHQIRTHMASIGHPVFGDNMYRGRDQRLDGLTSKDRQSAEKLLSSFPRQALHAQQIVLFHPSTEEEMVFSAPLPEDMENLLKVLRREEI
ncbi:RluA family pseudouridine synthase [candidate division KSB1 bacterium]